MCRKRQSIRDGVWVVMGCRSGQSIYIWGVVRVSEGSNDPDMCEEGWLGDRSSQRMVCG